MDGRKKCYSYFTNWDLKQRVLFGMFQQQDVLKQVVVSNFYLYIAFAVLQCKYLLCCVMNYVGEPIQAKNNDQKKSNYAQAAIVSKRNACQSYIYIYIYICLR